MLRATLSAHAIGSSAQFRLKQQKGFGKVSEQ
jgi:hypothetical protein